MLLIQADLALPQLLRHVVEEARSMTGARYAALGVLDEGHAVLEEFITVGLTPAEEDAIGLRPTGEGVLGLLIADPRPIRMAGLGDHPESSGFPPNHPPMSSFLGVPIKVRDEVYGNLYLTDKVGWSEFTGNDQALVEALALAAGIAVENSRLHDQAAAAAVFADRDRLARDLHDTIIQQLFGVGLSIQSVAAGSNPQGASERLNAAVATIDETIRQLRTTIFELGLGGTESGIRTKVTSLLEDLRGVIGFSIDPIFDGPVDTAVTDRVAEQLLPTLREALTNIGRHAEATRAEVLLEAGSGVCHLRVTDNGRGLDQGGKAGGGLGLNNMRRRAEKLDGDLTIGPGPDGGTELNWRVPLA